MNQISRTTAKLGTAALCGAMLVAAFVTTTPRPWLLAIIGMGLGCLSGYFRSRAIDAGNSTKSINMLGWLCGIGLLVLAMAFAEDMFIGAWAASLAGYLLADNLYSFPAIRRKARQGS